MLRGDRTSSWNRGDIRAFSASNSAGSLRWQEVALDVVPLSSDGGMLFFSDENWRQEPLASSDRVVFEESSFGQKRSVRDGLPCAERGVVEILSQSDPSRAVYLVSCPGRVNAGFGKPVNYDPNQFLLSGLNYAYWFQPKNHMLFKEIRLGPAVTGGGERSKIAAKDAQMWIHSDVKNFFTLDLSGSDMESYLEEYRSGSMSMVGRVQFYLKILFFKVKLSLTTDATFFGDSAHIPQMITLPDRAAGRLHPGSGIVYGWKPTDMGSFKIVNAQLPDVVPLGAKEGIDHVAAMAKPWCRSELCDFKLEFLAGGQNLAMDFRIPRRLVERGFFPQLIRDMKGMTKTAGWGDADEMGDVGLFFEVSALEAGTHVYDFWLRLGETRGRCPRSVSVVNY